MFTTLVRKEAGSVARICTFAVLTLLSIQSVPLFAQTTVPPVSLGAGMRTAFVHTSPEDDDSRDEFILDSVRLYVNGGATDKIKFMFNTEYNGGDNKLIVLDAVARFEMSDRFNVWVGRMLPPSDRANMYGPYYAHHWGVYTDGLQDGYPFVAVGRDNGVTYWGQFEKVKVSAGAFDGKSATGDDTLIGAGRVQVDFWDQEAGYYLNGTYYGGKNLLALGLAAQTQGSDKNAFNVDFLLERKIGTEGAAFSVESQYSRYDGLGGYNGSYTESDGAYILGSYLFPGTVGMGKFEVLGKFAQANFSTGKTPVDSDYNQKTTEINFNYLIKEFNARIMMFYIDTRFNAVQQNHQKVGVGFQLQM